MATSTAVYDCNAKRRYDEAEDRFYAFFDEFVALCGPSETVGGEIVSAVARINRRMYDDGEMIGVGYGNKTVNAPARYLINICKRSKLASDIWLMWGRPDGYMALLMELIEDTVAYLDTHLELFCRKNTESFLDYATPEDCLWALDLYGMVVLE